MAQQPSARPAGTAALILDFDGTILDTEAAFFQAWHEAFLAQGLEVDLARWRAAVGDHAAARPEDELAARLGGALPDGIDAWQERRRDELIAAMAPRPGVARWLDDARRLGVPVGVASSSGADWVHDHLDRLGWLDRFDAVLCCGGRWAPKPEPVVYREACAALGADPARSVAVEDSAHGVAAAVAAGLVAVAVPNPLTADQDLSAAALVAESLDDVDLEEALSLAAAMAHCREMRPAP
jgi:HAD superfamily hydrolase (TIGR01509 family)